MPPGLKQVFFPHKPSANQANSTDALHQAASTQCDPEGGPRRGEEVVRELLNVSGHEFHEQSASNRLVGHIAALPRTDVTPPQLLLQVLGWALPPLSEIIVSQIPEHVPRTKFPLPPMGQETFDLREYLTSSNDGNLAAGIKYKHAGVT